MEMARVEGIGGYVTVDRAARMLRITNDGVVKIIRRQHVPCVRLGRSLLVRPSDLALGTSRVLYEEVPD